MRHTQNSFTTQIRVSSLRLRKCHKVFFLYLRKNSMFRNNQQMHQFLSVYYFHLAAPTCFGNYVPSSGSSSVPPELHANLGFWLIKFCVVCGCVYILWRPGAYREPAPGRHIIHTYIHSWLFLNIGQITRYEN
jgi:hypothetical protein